MPDIKSELSKLANAWDAHEDSIRTKAKAIAPENTGNMSRDTFNYAGKVALTQNDLANAMASLGYTKSSVQAVITQMLRTGMLARVDDKMHPTQAEYTPLRNPYAKKKAKAKVKVSGIAALALPKAPDWESELNTMPLSTAYDLYKRLSIFFGGTKC